MYKTVGNVRYSECGPDNQIKLASIVNYFQDCTTENSESIGVGHDFLRERKRAWLLNFWQIEIIRRPKTGERIEVSTWATGFQGVMGPRDFKMNTSDGQELVQAHSLWVYVDTETGRPVKPTEEDISPYTVGEPLPMEQISRKIKVPEGCMEVDTFPVYQYHIDTNKHMNNSKYVELACEAIPEGFRVDKLRVEYKKAAVFGNVIVLKCIKQDTRIIAALCSEENETYAVVEFIGESL